MPTSATAFSRMRSEDDHSRSLVMLSRTSSISAFPFPGTWSRVYPSFWSLISMSLTLSIVSSPAALPILPDSGLDWYMRMATFLSERGLCLSLAHPHATFARWETLSGMGECLLPMAPPSMLPMGTVMICPSISGQKTLATISPLLRPLADSS